MPTLKLASLEIGDFEGTTVIDNELISFMRKQSHLKELSLRGWYNLPNGTLAKIIDENHNISSLYLSGAVSGEIFSDKIKLPELSEFTVRSYNFDVTGLKNLAFRANNLTVLYIMGGSSIAADALFTISQQFSLLEKITFGRLYFGHNVCIDFDRSVRDLANGCPKLKYVALRFTQKETITDIGVTHLFRSCPNLTYFDLNAQTEMTDNALFELSEHCPFLEHLFLSHCKFITAKRIIAILACCSRLRKLELAMCTNIQDIDSNANELTSTSSIHSHLLELTMKSCKYVSQRTVQHFAQICPDLRYLLLDRCFPADVDDERLIHEIHKHNKNVDINISI